MPDGVVPHRFQHPAVGLSRGERPVGSRRSMQQLDWPGHVGHQRSQLCVFSVAKRIMKPHGALPPHPLLVGDIHGIGPVIDQGGDPLDMGPAFRGHHGPRREEFAHDPMTKWRAIR
jgi:hypothetical protein